MTDPQDIIGIVRELQKRHSKQEPQWAYIHTQEAIIGEYGIGYRAIGLTGCGDGRTKGGKTARYIADLHNTFPSIAQALLDREAIVQDLEEKFGKIGAKFLIAENKLKIAVEALENTIRRGKSPDGLDDWFVSDCKEALSRIHSL